MRFSKTVLLFLGSIALLNAKKVTAPTVSEGNDKVEVQATISLDEQEIAQKLGADPGQGIVLLQVRVASKTGDPIHVSPDDFILLAHDDGERSKPFDDPAEIAGQGALVLHTSEGEKEKQKKTSIMAGLGPIGAGSGGGASSPGNPRNEKITSVKMDDKAQGNNTLLEALKAKQLAITDSVKPVEGFLYFPLQGKHKLKNMAVLYRGAGGKLNLEFQH